MGQPFLALRPTALPPLHSHVVRRFVTCRGCHWPADLLSLRQTGAPPILANRDPRCVLCRLEQGSIDAGTPNAGGWTRAPVHLGGCPGPSARRSPLVIFGSPMSLRYLGEPARFFSARACCVRRLRLVRLHCLEDSSGDRTGLLA